jgi:hypothetical protein
MAMDGTSFEENIQQPLKIESWEFRRRFRDRFQNI